MGQEIPRRRRSVSMAQWGAIGRTKDKDGNGQSSSFVSGWDPAPKSNRDGLGSRDNKPVVHKAPFWCGAIALPVGRVAAKISPEGCVLSRLGSEGAAT